MTTPENGNGEQQALRLAQLEIKMLRAQLLKAIDEAQAARDAAQKVTAPAPTPQIVPPFPAQPPPHDVITEMTAATGENRVLCIEDSQANFQLIDAILLDRPGTDLRWAENGDKGVEMAASTRPELVLLDLDLPDMHGSEVLAKLRAQPATAETPVIVISADATPSQIERMLAAGARDYITKPFEIRRFLLMFDEIFPLKS